MPAFAYNSASFASICEETRLPPTFFAASSLSSSQAGFEYAHVPARSAAVTFNEISEPARFPTVSLFKTSFSDHWAFAVRHDMQHDKNINTKYFIFSELKFLKSNPP